MRLSKQSRSTSSRKLLSNQQSMPAQEGTVTFCSRRSFGIVTPENKNFFGRTLSKHSELTVGDHIKFRLADDSVLVDTILEKKNFLWRSYLDRVKIIAANIDQLFIVTAYDATFNSLFVDKVILISILQNIPFTIVFNKMDLKSDRKVQISDIYQKIGFTIIETSTKTLISSNKNEGSTQKSIEDFKSNILNLYNTVIFCGVSGVGKSSLLNSIAPNAKKETQELSEKTGKGKQTTTLAKAHSIGRIDQQPLLLIDTPGIQNFGLSLVQIEDVQKGFPEIQELSSECKYGDCLHYNLNKNKKNQESTFHKRGNQVENSDNEYEFNLIKLNIVNDNSLLDVCAVRRSVQEQLLEVTKLGGMHADRACDDQICNEQSIEKSFDRPFVSINRYLSYCKILEEVNQMPFFEKNNLRASKFSSESNKNSI